VLAIAGRSAPPRALTLSLPMMQACWILCSAMSDLGTAA